jgi:hypothetical protein
LDLLRQLGDHKVVASTDELLEFVLGQEGQVLEAHPMALRALGRLDEPVILDQYIKLLGRAFERDAARDFAVDRDDDEDLSGDLEDEVARLVDEGGVREGEGESLQGARRMGILGDRGRR